MIQPATDTEGSGRGIPNRVVVWTEGPANGAPYFGPATLPNPMKSDMKTAAASRWADNKVYTWRSLRGTELVIFKEMSYSLF